MRSGSGMLGACIRAGSLTAGATEFARYQLDLVDVQGFRWDTVGTVRVGDYNFFCGKGNEIHHLGTEFSEHHNIVSAVKVVEFVRDRVSYNSDTTTRALLNGVSKQVSMMTSYFLWQQN
jgi:hypothetical protein